MKSSAELVKAIQSFEGLRLNAYRCAAGVWTIGYGHTQDVRRGQTITREQAVAFLMADLATFERYVNSIPEITTQGQFDAVVDFVFNLGIRPFAHSTLYRYIRARRSTADIQNEFRRWVYANGVRLSGLAKRREWEAKRWAQKS